MALWEVSTEHKKCVFEHELWEKDDFVIRRITGFRWGTVLITTKDDTPPVLEQTDGPGADAVDMYNTDYDYELDSLDDGWYEDFVWPDDMEEEERERLLALWEDENYAGWEEEGWIQYETECWFHGPLSIVLNEWKEPEEDEWVRAEITPELQNHFQKAIEESETDQTVNKPLPVWPFPTGDRNDKSS